MFTERHGLEIDVISQWREHGRKSYNERSFCMENLAHVYLRFHVERRHVGTTKNS